LGVTEETFRLRQEVTGADKVADLERQLRAVLDAVGDLQVAYAQGLHSEADYSVETKRLATEQSRLAQELGRAKKALDTTRSGMAGAGLATMETGRIIQDIAQGGIGGALNNIERLTMSLGGGPGLAGVLTGVGVALFLLKPHLTEIAHALGLVGSEADKAADEVGRMEARVKELTDKPVKVAVDLNEMDRLKASLDEVKAAIQAVERLRKTQGTFEKESGQQIQENIAEAQGGDGKLADDVTRALRPTIEAQSAGLADARKRQGDAQALLDWFKRGGTTGSFQRDAEQKADAENALKQARLDAMNAMTEVGREATKQASLIIQRATQGTGQEQALAQRQLADLLDKAGRGADARGVRLSSPAAMKAEAEAEADLDASVDRQKEGGKGRDARQKGEKKEFDEAVDKAMRLNAEDVEAEALKAIAAGGDKVKVGVDLGEKLEKQLRDAGFGPDGRQADIATEVVGRVLQKISGKDVEAEQGRQAKAEARGEKAEARDQAGANAQAKRIRDDQEKEREARDKALEKGLGNDFLAQAESQRLSIEQNPMLSNRQREQQRAAFQRDLMKQAEQRLVNSGVEPGKASDLALAAPEFVNRDIRRQLGQVVNQGVPQNQAVNALQQNLQRNMAGADQSLDALTGQLVKNQGAMAGWIDGVDRRARRGAGEARRVGDFVQQRSRSNQNSDGL
jgi:hypothetical protein